MAKQYTVTLSDEDVEVVAFRAEEGKTTEDEAVLFALQRDLGRDKGQIDASKARTLLARYRSLDAAGKQVIDAELAKGPNVVDD